MKHGNYELRGYDKHNHCSRACAIDLGSSVILTGGRDSPTKVSEYWLRQSDEAVFVTDDLPDLQQERYDHGCSFYYNDIGTKVNIEKVVTKLSKYYHLLIDVVSSHHIY